MKLIIAATPQGGIGYQNRLPWDNLTGDLKRFRELTTGYPVIMGSNTWRSLPVHPLPNRYNVVIGSKPELPAHSTVWLTSDQIPNLPQLFPDGWVIGGARLIEATLPLVTEIHLSRTFSSYQCDAFIDIDSIPQQFTLTHAEPHTDHSYEVWTRRA